MSADDRAARDLRIWVLLGHRKGDNNQLLALAQALHLPFETRSLRYNILRKVPKQILPRQLVSVRDEALKWVNPPWPDLILGVGHRSVPVGQFIRRANDGRTKLVQLGNPRIHPRHFDLVITSPQYGIEDYPNVVRLPLAMNSPVASVSPTEEERRLLESLPRPHRLLVIGGPNKHWFVDAEDASAAATTLMQRSDTDGGTLIAIGSPRTPGEVLHAVGQCVSGTRHLFVNGPMPRYRVLLDDADELFVTADSVSMLSEAIFTGKPVGMVPIRNSRRGKVAHALNVAGVTRDPRPNLRAVWRSLAANELVGTLEQPRAAHARDPVDVAAEAVRLLVGATG